MHVSFISRCVKKARKNTEAVLDAHSFRDGPGRWETVTTKRGLAKIKAGLIKVSTPQTSVACCQHDEDGKRLLWVVGNENLFDLEAERPGEEIGRAHV